MVSSARLRWIGHVISCDPGGPLRKVLEDSHGECKLRGRPRRLHILELDLEELGIRRGGEKQKKHLPGE